MVNPISNEAVGGVKVVYDDVNNNFTFTSSTRGEGTLLSIKVHYVLVSTILHLAWVKPRW